MHRKLSFAVLFTCLLALVVVPTTAQNRTPKSCFTAEARADAERTAKVWREPDAGYDPVLGYNPTNGPRTGAPPVNAEGVATPIVCVANKDETEGSGTTPKFHCSVAGVVEKDGDLVALQSEASFQRTSTRQT